MASWRSARFKGKPVFAKVDAAGTVEASEGRVPIRYSDKAGARIYRAGVARVELVADGEIRSLDDGVGAPESPKGARSAGGKRRSPKSIVYDPIPEGVVVAYTDGACSGNPGPAGAGALVQLPNGRVGESSQWLGQATNNVGELAAIGLALDLLETGGVKPDSTVVLYSDSNYARGVLTLGWKAKANRELILGLRERLTVWSALEIRWVPGHEGVDGNERADELARAGAQGTTHEVWTG